MRLQSRVSVQKQKPAKNAPKSAEEPVYLHLRGQGSAPPTSPCQVDLQTRAPARNKQPSSTGMYTAVATLGVTKPLNTFWEVPPEVGSLKNKDPASSRQKHAQNQILAIASGNPRQDHLQSLALVSWNTRPISEALYNPVLFGHIRSLFTALLQVSFQPGPCPASKARFARPRGS